MRTDSESEDSDLDDYEEWSDSSLPDLFDGINEENSDDESPKKKRKSTSPVKNSGKKGNNSNDCIIIVSDDDSSSTDIGGKGTKTELEKPASGNDNSADLGDRITVPKCKTRRSKIDSKKPASDNESSSDGTYRITIPKHKTRRSKSANDSKKRLKAKTKQRQRKNDIRDYLTPRRAKKLKDSENSPSRTGKNPARKIPCRRNVKGETPLHTACIKGNFERVKLLIKQGHELNAQDNAGWTPLHEAANHNQLEIAKFLVDNGAEINHQGGGECDGETPLIDAATNGHIHMMKLLIDKGADCRCRDKENQSALEALSSWRQSKDIKDVEFLREFDHVVSILKKKMGQKSSRATKSKSKSTLSTAKSTLDVQQPSCSYIDDTELMNGGDDVGDSDTQQDTVPSPESHTPGESPVPSETTQDPGSSTDSNKVVLLIPSIFEVPYEEHVALQQELGVGPDQCILWPSVEMKNDMTEDHLPHIMLDVVDCVKNGDMTRVTKLLTGFTSEQYKFYLEQKNGVIPDILFFTIVDDLSEINRNKERRVGWLFNRESFHALVLFLYCDIPEHKHLVSCFKENIHVWSEFTTLRNMQKRLLKPKEEYEKLLKWFGGKLITMYHTDIYPSRQSLFPMEKILYCEKNSCSITVDLISALSNKKRRSTNSDCEISIIGIDGVNREVLKYTTFIKKAIESFLDDTLCKEIFFIVSVEKSDEIDTLRDILPADFMPSCRVYTAFNPMKICPSCIVIHIKSKDIKDFNSRHTRAASQPSTSSHDT